MQTPGRAVAAMALDAAIAAPLPLMSKLPSPPPQVGAIDRSIDRAPPRRVAEVDSSWRSHLDRSTRSRTPHYSTLHYITLYYMTLYYT
jgi:hypothetical protein